MAAGSRRTMSTRRPGARRGRGSRRFLLRLDTLGLSRSQALRRHLLFGQYFCTLRALEYGVNSRPQKAHSMRSSANASATPSGCSCALIAALWCSLAVVILTRNPQPPPPAPSAPTLRHPGRGGELEPRRHSLSPRGRPRPSVPPSGRRSSRRAREGGPGGQSRINPCRGRTRRPRP